MDKEQTIEKIFELMQPAFNKETLEEGESCFFVSTMKSTGRPLTLGQDVDLENNTAPEADTEADTEGRMRLAVFNVGMLGDLRSTFTRVFENNSSLVPPIMAACMEQLSIYLDEEQVNGLKKAMVAHTLFGANGSNGMAKEIIEKLMFDGENTDSLKVLALDAESGQRLTREEVATLLSSEIVSNIKRSLIKRGKRTANTAGEPGSNFESFL